MLLNPQGPMTEVSIARIAPPSTLLQVLTADVNNDDRLDAIVFWRDAAVFGSERLVIDTYLGHPDGTFTVGSSVDAGNLPSTSTLSVFDMTGDGQADLFLRNNNEVRVFRGHGNGRFAPPVTTTFLAGAVTGIAFEHDLDGDGVADMALSANAFLSQTLAVYKGLPTGGYNPVASFIDGGHNLVLTDLRDLNGDGKLDILAYSASPFAQPGDPATVYVFRNNGDATFTQSFASPQLSGGYWSQSIGGVPIKPLQTPDLSGDGQPDLLLLERSGLSGTTLKIHVMRNDGNAGFTAAQLLTIGNFPSTGSVIVADIDDDGAADLFVQQFTTTDNVGWHGTAYFNAGNATFTTPGVTFTPPQQGTEPPVLADFNADGKLDVVLTGFAVPSGNTVAMALLNTTGREFAPGVETVASILPLLPPPRDLDGDGLPDLLTFFTNAAPVNAASFQVLSSNGDGSFTAQTRVYNDGASRNRLIPIVGDFNGDGMPDLVFEGGTGVFVAINGKPMPPSAGADLGTIASSTHLAGFLPGYGTPGGIDTFTFSVEEATRVRVTLTPEASALGLRLTAMPTSVGGGGDLTPRVLERDVEPGTVYHIDVTKVTGGSTRYRLDIEFPGAPGGAPAIGVLHGLAGVTSGQPQPIDFGTVFRTATDTTNHTSFRIFNRGSSTLNLGAITLPAGFIFEEAPGVAALAPGESAAFKLKLVTDAVGVFSGNVVIPGTNEGVAPFLLPVRGVVEELLLDPLIDVRVDGNAAVFSSQTTPIDFGTVLQNTTGPTKIFTVVNVGDGVLDLGVPQLPFGYTLVEPLASSLGPGASDTFTVRLDTGFAATYSGNIVISHDSGGELDTFLIPITGRVNASGGGGGGGGVLPDLSGQVLGVKLNNRPLGAGDLVIPGDRVAVKLRVRNVGGATLQPQPLVINLFASADESFDGGDDLIQAFAFVLPRLNGGQNPPAHVDLTLNFVVPPDATAGEYFLLAQLDPFNLILEADETNNVAASPLAVPVVLEAGQVGSRRNVRLALVDADGTPVTFALTGGGTASVSLNPDTGYFDVLVTGTTAASTLTITTRPSRLPGDDGMVDLGDVLVEGPLRSLRGTTANLRGDLTVAGMLGSVTLNEVASPQKTLTIGQPSANVVLKFGAVADLSIDAPGSTIRSLTALDWQDANEAPDLITARSVGTLKITGRRANPARGIAALAGDLAAGLALGPAQPAARPAKVLGNATVAGALRGAWTLVNGEAGRITAGGADDFTLAISGGSVAGLSLGHVSAASIATDADRAIGTIAAHQWESGLIDIGSTRSLAIAGRRANAARGLAALRGDMGASVRLRDANTSLATLRIAGLLHDATIDARGGVGNATLGALLNANLLAGLDAAHLEAGLPDSPDAFAAVKAIRRLTVAGRVAGVAQAFANSNIAAAVLGSVTLRDVDPAADGEFGVAALRSIGSYSRFVGNTLAVRKSNLKAADSNIDALLGGSFRVRVIAGV